MARCRKRRGNSSRSAGRVDGCHCHFGAGCQFDKADRQSGGRTVRRAEQQFVDPAAVVECRGVRRQCDPILGSWPNGARLATRRSSCEHKRHETFDDFNFLRRIIVY